MDKVQAENLPSRTKKKRLRTSVEFYLRSVARCWKTGVLGADRVVVLSPFLTSTLAQDLLRLTTGKCFEVYTAFRAENFASGASSIQTLIGLQKHGWPSTSCQIFMQKLS